MFYPVKIICYCVIISSMKLQFSASISLTQEEYNIIANRPMKLVCNIGTNITNTVTIESPDNLAVVSCSPASKLPPIAATCATSGVIYAGSIDETTNTVTVTTNTLPGDVNGTWSCTHGSSVATIVFPSPIPCLISENFDLSPTSTGNVTSTTAKFSLTATYSCINVDVTFKWILKAGTSHEFTSVSVSKDSAACTDSGTCTGVSAYTQTINSDSLFQFAKAQSLIGGYELSAEAHYSDGVTALKSHSIGYFEFRHDTTTVEISTATTDDKSTTSKNLSTSTFDLRTTETKGNMTIVSSTSLYKISMVTVSTQTLSVNRSKNITVDNLYLIPVIGISLVCLLVVILAIGVTVLYHCDRLPISNKSNKYISAEESKTHTEIDKSVKHKRRTESTRKADKNIKKKTSGDKQKKYNRNKNEQNTGSRIKDKRGISETESIQFYAQRKSRNDNYLEMSETANTQRNTGITDMPKIGGFDRKVTLPINSQMNVKGSQFHGYTKCSDSKMLDFQDHDYNYFKRYQQDRFFLGDQHFDNRRIRANYLSDRHKLADIHPYYHNDRHQTNRSYSMASYGKYWSDNLDHDRQQPYSSCSSYWY